MMITVTFKILMYIQWKWGNTCFEGFRAVWWMQMKQTRLSINYTSLVCWWQQGIFINTEFSKNHNLEIQTVQFSWVKECKVGGLVVGKEDGEMEEQGVRGGINFLRDCKPVLEVLHHCSCAHVGWVETTENQGLEWSEAIIEYLFNRSLKSSRSGRQKVVTDKELRKTQEAKYLKH